MMQRMTQRFSTVHIAFAVAILVACGIVAYFWSDLTAVDEKSIETLISGSGPIGPVLMIGLMTLAIVVSPIPSGPIALAAGAVFGTLLGAVYVIIGAVLGAVIAFGTARWFGHAAIRASDNGVLRFIAAPRSQAALMAVVFASRLVPFVSFDAVSYAAGVTNLTFPRFVVATVLGVVPVSFALTAMGAGLHDHGPSPALLAAIAGITLVPVIGKWVWDKIRQPRTTPKDGH
jgi:uncharacterized membrane protein YdjX (TVP38/TMEM64 family)